MVSRVYLIGAGLGNPDTLTGVAVRALDQSDLIIGAERIIEALEGFGAKKLCLYRTDDIMDALDKSQAEVVSVALSGDIGLFSGATELARRLKDLKCVEVISIAGISSVAYLAAKISVTYQDATIVSVHGRKADVCGAVRCHKQTFVYTGGKATPQTVAAELVSGGLGSVRMVVGERLSYSDERIVEGTAEEISEQDFSGLNLVYVENDRIVDTSLPRHIADDEFTRGKVPMTKDEVRALVCAKLQIEPSDTVFDIGAGTGSVAIEMAHAAYAGRVFAIEHKEEALALIQENRDRLGAHNLEVIAGEAPNALHGLPTPDKVFVGGSGGHLEEIISAVIEANPSVRIVVSAITLETLSTALAVTQAVGCAEPKVTQVQITRSHKVAGHTMMRAENPIHLIELSRGEPQC